MRCSLAGCARGVGLKIPPSATITSQAGKQVKSGKWSRFQGRIIEHFKTRRHLDHLKKLTNTTTDALTSEEGVAYTIVTMVLENVQRGDSYR